MAQRVAYNIYLTEPLHRQLTRLVGAGLSASAVARLAIRKRPSVLPEGIEGSYPVRTNMYVEKDDAEVLTELAASHGLSKAEVLRRLLMDYLETHSSCIDALF